MLRAREKDGDNGKTSYASGTGSVLYSVIMITALTQPANRRDGIRAELPSAAPRTKATNLLIASAHSDIVVFID